MSNTKVKAKDHDSYGVYTLLSVFIPLAGIIMEAIMLTKEKQIDKKLGEHAIVCSVFGLIAYGLIWGAWLYFMTNQATDPLLYY